MGRISPSVYGTEKKVLKERPIRNLRARHLILNTNNVGKTTKGRSQKNKCLKGLPEDKEGYMLCDERRGDSGDQSNQVGDDDGWQAAIVVAETKKISQNPIFFDL